MALSRNDLSVIEGDARIADHHINEVLGMARVREVRALIRRHEDELETYGSIFAANSRENTRGRPTVTYYLTEEQATLVCMFARTPRAAEARRQIIEVFTAWRRGELAGSPAPLAGQPDPLTAQGDHLAKVNRVLRELGAMDSLAAQATYLPIWSNGRRPDWWSNVELREFLILMHRQVTLQSAAAAAKQRWPDTPISLAATQRFWAKLDSVRRNHPPVAASAPLRLVHPRQEIA